MPAGCLALFLISIFLGLLPIFLANVAVTALARLGISPALAPFILLGVLMGSMVNIPVTKLHHHKSIRMNSAAMFGIGSIFPHFTRQRSSTLIAVNVGGCLIPIALALYQIVRISTFGLIPFAISFIAIGMNVIVCYYAARPVPGLGIAMRPFIPGLLAALSAILLMPNFAPPLAFTAGVFGPLIGADLLHLKDLTRSPTGMSSIGGAGTFDGIVITGLIALLLA